MKFKITLVELERLLFPERFPFFNEHFATELDLLSKESLSDISFQNIKFKTKLAGYSCNIRDEESRRILSHIFEKHIVAYYDWHNEYDWYELKSILFYFAVFSHVKNSGDIIKHFQNKQLGKIFEKYLPSVNLQKT
jgi:hypothetical protein